MSDHSRFNLGFLKKQAKGLLKQCRASDSEAIERIRARLPHPAKSDATRADMKIRLADVQHALARELGYEKWGNLQRMYAGIDTADYSKPGAEGTLPDGFTPWRWAVSYTVRPEVLSTLVCGEEYRIGATVLRSRPDDAVFRGYAELYERAYTIAKGRVSQLRCNKACQTFHTRIIGHTWFRHGATNLVRAAVTFGVTCLSKGTTGPNGESSPALEALAASAGMTPEQLAASTVKKGFDEIYSDGDVRMAPDPDGIFSFSYGEYVKTVEGIDYEPLMKRAEHLTRFHLRLKKVNILRREWFCATRPDIAVVHIYVRR